MNGSGEPRKSLVVPIVLLAVACFLLWLLAIVPNDFMLLTVLALASAAAAVAAVIIGWRNTATSD
jgi:hypothetical protein